jgi:uncharacterized protein YndB with AHSA1/START domain
MGEVSTSPGRVISDPEGVRLEFDRELPEPIDVVWAAFTEPTELERWIGTWSGDGRVGGTVIFQMTVEGAAEGEAVLIVDCAPPTHLVVDWQIPDQPKWQVEVTLHSTSESVTGVTFVHRMTSSDALGDIGPGWQYYLDRLEASLAQTPMPEWDDYYPALKNLYDDTETDA